MVILGKFPVIVIIVELNTAIMVSLTVSGNALNHHLPLLDISQMYKYTRA